MLLGFALWSEVTWNHFPLGPLAIFRLHKRFIRLDGFRSGSCMLRPNWTNINLQFSQLLFLGLQFFLQFLDDKLLLINDLCLFFLSLGISFVRFMKFSVFILEILVLFLKNFFFLNFALQFLVFLL